MIARPDLYKGNCVSHDERLENLSVLLGDALPSSSTDIQLQLPSNSDALKVIAPTTQAADPSEDHSDEIDSVEVNNLYVTLWTENGTKTWYIGYCTGFNSGKAIIDHLHRIRKNSNVVWKYPEKADLAEVMSDQVLAVRPIGQWDLTHSRKMTFKLNNVKDILKAITCLAKQQE